MPSLLEAQRNFVATINEGPSALPSDKPTEWKLIG